MTLNDLKQNIASVIAKMKANLAGKGVAVDESDTLHTLADKVNDISSTPSNPNIYTVDLSIYNFTEEELFEAKKILDHNLIDIWRSNEGQTILNMPDSNYAYNTFNNLVNNNGYIRPILIPSIKTSANNIMNVIPRADELRSAIYRGNISYNGNVTDDYRARKMDYICSNNYSITKIPLGNWSEMCSSCDNGFNGCNSLTEVDLSLPECTSVGSLFSNCKNIKKARLIIPKVTSSRWMFQSCEKIEELYLDMPLNNRFDYTLERCNSIKKLTVIFGENIASYTNNFNWEFPGNYTLLKNICMNASATVLPLNNITNWGEGSEENRQSLIDTLITYSFDRVTAGYSSATIQLRANVKALLTEDEITQITNKGYTIA